MSKNEYYIDYNKVPVKENFTEKQEIPITYGYGVRHIQLIIVFLSLTVSFIARGHLGVTVVAMTSNSKESTALNTTIYIADKIYNSNTTENVTIVNGKNKIILNALNATNLSLVKQNVTNRIKKFSWPKSKQEMVLGSFFVGYCIMTFPMGLVTQRWGGKLPMQIALFVNGVVSIIAPWLTFWGDWKAVCFCRILQGLSQAGVYPSVQALLANWVPMTERGTLSSYVYTGTTLGTVIAFQLAGFLGDSRWGWPSTFWAIGGISLLTFLFLTFFGSATPAQHRFISEAEKNYIMGRADDGIIRKRPKTPWKAMLTSKPLWGTIATHVGSGAAFVFFFTQVPSYIHYILGVDLKRSGILSSLPYIFSFFSSITFGIVSDYCTNRNLISLKNARRISNSISQVGVAICLVCATFTTSTVIAVTCLVMAMTCHMGIHTGWMVNHIDLAPNFSGTLMAIGNTLMNIINVLLPIMVSHVVTDVGNQTQWRIMFITISGLAFVTNAIFVLLLSSDTQPWNNSDKQNGIPSKELTTKELEKEEK